jgi:phosphoribosylformimino-5-aminoimidazole carboxamide ribotide isomerase
MDLVPVIDLKSGQVVRGVAGQRRDYALNTSVLTNSADPIATCEALLTNYRTPVIYVADLDAIEGGKIQEESLRSLAGCGAPLAVDAGTASVAQAEFLLSLGIAKVIIGLETLPDLNLTVDLVRALGPERAVFSLDLQSGRPLGAGSRGKPAIEVVSDVIEAGVRHIIVLDLASIGMSRGVPTGPLCHSIKNRWPDLIVWTGGGVRSLADLHRLSLCRVDGVMAASALHRGDITPSDWETFQDLLSDDQTMLMVDG